MVSTLILALLMQAAQPASAADFAVRDADRALVHSATGFVFPAQAKGFVRQNHDFGQPDGEYVTARYEKRLPRGTAAKVRVNLVHIEDMTPQQHFIIRKTDLLADRTVVKTVEEGPYHIERPAKLDGWHGIFLTDAAAQPGQRDMRSLWTFYVNGWSIRIVAEYPPANNSAVRASIRQFLNALDWSKLTNAKPPMAS